MDDIILLLKLRARDKAMQSAFCDVITEFCQDTETFLTPDTSGPFFISGVVAAAIGLAALPIRIAWIPVVAVFDAYYAGIAFYQSFSDIYTIWTDPNKLYPDTLALSVQSFTYFTVKAWFDTYLPTTKPWSLFSGPSHQCIWFRGCCIVFHLFSM